MGNLISNIIHTSTRPKRASLNVLMFHSPHSLMISFGYTRHNFYVFNTHEDKSWNSKPILIPKNFNLVSDDSLTASPLIDMNYDLIMYHNPKLEQTAIEYSKKLHIPILLIQNNSFEQKKLYYDVVAYKNEAVKKSCFGNQAEYVCDSILADQEQNTIEDFCSKWDAILMDASSRTCGVYYENM